MIDFFELARSSGFLRKEDRNRLLKLRKTKLLDFAIEASFSLPARDHTQDSRYGFVTNKPLSGGPFPCTETRCRVDRADHLARFAALYADHIVIQNPFSVYTPDMPVDSLRSRLEGDIAVLGHLEPLIQSGFISVIPPGIAMCTACASHFKARREQLARVLQKAGDEMLDHFISRVTFTREKTGYIGIRGPTDLIAHGVQFVLPPPASPVNGRLTRPRKEALVRWLISSLLEDVYLHHLQLRHTAFNYLTDRELDLGIIRRIGGRAVRSIDRALLDGLAHKVPIVMNADVSEILRLRKAEGEAFAVYRNAVAAVLHNADLSTPEAVKDAFMSKINPELGKIDLAARNARKLSRRAVAKEIAISTAAVSIGMLVGTVQPTIGAVLAALGGVNAMRTVADKVADTLGEPPIVRESSFYFLWKLQQRASRLRSK